MVSVLYSVLITLVSETIKKEQVRHEVLKPRMDKKVVLCSDGSIYETFLRKGIFLTSA